jgi:GTPase involved in cell partitioning and DNA repair
LHQEALIWLSEIEFYKTEIIFLTKLLDIAFLRVTSAGNLERMKLLEKKINDFREKTLDDLHAKVISHENQISALDEDEFQKNKSAVDEVHHGHFREIMTFKNEVRELKKEIFELVENQLKRAKKTSMHFADGNSIF